MAAFATGVLPNIYEFHLYTGNSAILSRSPARQYRASEPPSPLVFLRISTNFTSTLAVPLTSPELEIASFEGSSGVELQDFTPDLAIRLRALYAQ